LIGVYHLFTLSSGSYTSHEEPINGMAMRSIRVREETKVMLDDLKAHPADTYDSIICRLIDSVYDDEPLTREEIEGIKASEADIQAGRFRSLEEISRDLGDDLVVR